MKINELSKKTGLSISTSRFYEKQDLIPEKYVSRDSNNYRNYSADIIEHLLMIKTVHSVGFSLTEIKEIQKSNANSISVDTKIELYIEFVANESFSNLPYKERYNLNKMTGIYAMLIKDLYRDC